MLLDDIRNLNNIVSRQLCHMMSAKDTSLYSMEKSRLLFPLKRNNKIRISEQESRFLFAENISNYYYSVETPTQTTYSFTGKSGKERSASTDMSLYTFNEGNFHQVANIEFKAHTNDTIKKDIIKLVKESHLLGNWFHTLPNIDSGTLKSLFKKYKAAFKSCGAGVRNVNILFCICIIKEKYAISKHFEFDSNTNKSILFDDYLKDFFQYEIKKKAGMKSGESIKGELKEQRWELWDYE